MSWAWPSDLALQWQVRASRDCLGAHLGAASFLALLPSSLLLLCSSPLLSPSLFSSLQTHLRSGLRRLLPRTFASCWS